MKRRICKYYKHPKNCTNKDFCMEQLISEPTHCCSILYYSMGLEQEIKNEKEAAQIDINNLEQACSELKKELEEKIQEYEKLKIELTATEKLREINSVGYEHSVLIYNQAFDEIKEIATLAQNTKPLNGELIVDTFEREHYYFQQIIDVINKIKEQQ